MLVDHEPLQGIQAVTLINIHAPVSRDEPSVLDGAGGGRSAATLVASHLRASPVKREKL